MKPLLHTKATMSWTCEWYVVRWLSHTNLHKPMFQTENKEKNDIPPFKEASIPACHNGVGEGNRSLTLPQRTCHPTNAFSENTKNNKSNFRFDFNSKRFTLIHQVPKIFNNIQRSNIQLSKQHINAISSTPSCPPLPPVGYASKAPRPLARHGVQLKLMIEGVL